MLSLCPTKASIYASFFLSGINLDNSLPISVNLYIDKPTAFSCCEINYLTIIQECKFFSAIKNDRELIRVGEKPTWLLDRKYHAYSF